MCADFTVGDSVAAKPGTEDPDMGGDINGWQGRIVEIYPPEQDAPPIVMLNWDSITLRNIPELAIIHCEREGLDWGTMGLFAHDVVLAEARDTEQDVANTKEEITDRYFWFGIGDDEPQGRRIQTVVNSADQRPGRHREMAVMEAWDSYLRSNLTLPLDAEIYEFQERGPLRTGDRVRVISFSELDDLYGLLVNVRHRRRIYHFPLCDLNVLDHNSPNYQIIVDYRVWYANRG
ncbi:calcium-binding protein [Chloroflexota bacterium]